MKHQPNSREGKFAKARLSPDAKALAQERELALCPDQVARMAYFTYATTFATLSLDDVLAAME